MVYALYNDNILYDPLNKKQWMSNEGQIQLEKHSFRMV